MQLVHRFVSPYLCAYTSASSDVAIPFGDYQPLDPSGTNMRGWLEFRGEQGNASVSIGVLTANDLTAAGTLTKACAYLTADGVGNPDSTAKTLDPVPSKLVRPCFAIKSDGTLAGGMMRGVVEIWAP